jgi:hypothetical protein
MAGVSGTGRIIVRDCFASISAAAPFASSPARSVCECDDAPSKCWWCDQGRLPLYYIFSLFARGRHSFLECIPLYTSSPALPSLRTLHVEVPVSLDPQAAHSVHPQSWLLRLPQPCSMRLFPHLAPGPPSRPTFKRRDTTTRMARASSIPGTRTLSVAPSS